MISVLYFHNQPFIKVTFFLFFRNHCFHWQLRISMGIYSHKITSLATETLNFTDKMFEQTFKNIDDILHKDAGCGSELDYVEQTSWVLFLKYLGEPVQPKMLKHVGMAISTDIRRRGWKGVWRDGESYFEGQEVTHNGVRWFALKDSPGKPGTPDSGWQMTEKSRR